MIVRPERRGGFAEFFVSFGKPEGQAKIEKVKVCFSPLSSVSLLLMSHRTHVSNTQVQKQVPTNRLDVERLNASLDDIESKISDVLNHVCS